MVISYNASHTLVHILENVLYQQILHFGTFELSPDKAKEKISHGNRGETDNNQETEENDAEDGVQDGDGDETFFDPVGPGILWWEGV